MTYGETAWLEKLEAMGYREPVRAYQADAGLVVDGILGPQTRCSIIADEAARETPGLEDFSGSLALLVRLEGHRGCPYWPGGGSGVTLDPGFDLGQQTRDRLFSLYRPIWGRQGTEELATAIGLRGQDAAAWIETWRPSLGRWSITRECSAELLPVVCVPYWAALERCLGTMAGCPAPVQSALLSFVYNCWVDDLTSDMESAAVGGRWVDLADLLEASPKGDPRRRRIEADLIRRSA